MTAAAALSYRDFRLFQLSRFSQTIGVQILSVAVGFQVYDVTRRPLALGYVGLAQFLPGLLLALPAGHIADRFDRRRVVTLCQAACIACSVALLVVLRGAVHDVWPVYVVLTIFGATRGLSGPAGQALMPDLVPTEHFSNAVAWGSSAFQVATIIGPAAGGAAYAAGGPDFAYVLSAGLFTLAAVATTFIRTVPTRSREPVSAETLFAGVRYVFRNKIILGAISLDLFAVLLGGATALLPIYARDILRVGPSGLGLLRSAPGVGAALTALLLAYRPLGKNAGRTLYVCVALFGVATVVFGLSTSFGVSLAALFVLGASDLVSVVVRHTVVQLSTPAAMRGRVAAVNFVFIGASNELGEFESGATAALLGTVGAVVLGGVGTCLVVAIWSLVFPDLRNIDRLDASS